MKKILFSLALSIGLTAQAFAQFPLSRIDDFNANYTDGNTGSGVAAYFSFEDIDYGENVQFYLYKNPGSILLITPDDQFEVNNLPDFVDELENVNFSQFNLNSDGQDVQLGLGELNGSTSTESLSLSNLSLGCSHSGATGELMDEILDSCLNNSGKFSLDQMVTTKDGKAETIKNLRFNINNTNMTFSAKAMGFTVKGKGQTFYESGLVRIRIDKAKTGFFSVKGKLFKELKKLESPNVTVRNPWIEISF